MTQRELYDVMLDGYIAAACGAAIAPKACASTEERVAIAIGLTVGSARGNIPTMRSMTDDIRAALDGTERQTIELVNEIGVQYTVQILGEKIPAGRYRVY